MKKIFESELNSTDYYSAERIYLYALENEDEWWELESMSHDEKCKYFDVEEEYGVAPGALYHRYEFNLTSTHITMSEVIARNV